MPSRQLPGFYHKSGYHPSFSPLPVQFRHGFAGLPLIDCWFPRLDPRPKSSSQIMWLLVSLRPSALSLYIRVTVTASDLGIMYFHDQFVVPTAATCHPFGHVPGDFLSSRRESHSAKLALRYKGPFGRPLSISLPVQISFTALFITLPSSVLNNFSPLNIAPKTPWPRTLSTRYFLRIGSFVQPISLCTNRTSQCKLCIILSALIIPTASRYLRYSRTLELVTLLSPLSLILFITDPYNLPLLRYWTKLAFRKNTMFITDLSLLLRQTFLCSTHVASGDVGTSLS